ncbi:RAP domain [Cinara cedri]|uniref:RAP domain n=1 Tax=Cinara cedri TaxID=506608 RepID=A0A5E4NMI3_9HEMI|nr:RAP domain [Cinara cedri]
MNRALYRLTAFPKRVVAVVRPVARTANSSLSISRPTPFLQQDGLLRRNIIANDPNYRETTIEVRIDWPVVTDERFAALSSQDWSAATVDEVCDNFLLITSYSAPRGLQLQDTVFDELRNRLVTILPDMTDQQLMDMLQLIARWNVKNPYDPIYRKFWSLFDKQCIARYKNWSLNKLLLYMDHWYAMGLIKLSDFVWLSVRKLARKPSRLTPNQLIQMIFYANYARKFSHKLPMYEIEQEVSSYYNDFNIKELSLVALCFFKTEMTIRNQELVKQMYNSVINEITNIEVVQLTTFLKIFIYCTKYSNADSMYKLMDVLVEKVNEVDLICCIHMALLGTKLMIRHEKLLKTISQRIVNEISQARIKDMERLMFALSTLNYNPHTTPCIFESIVKELRNNSRSIDFERHTKSYILVLSNLAVMGIFPYDCISKALKKEMLHKCFGKRLSRFSVPRDIVSLNNSLLIECPDYSGPLLPDVLKVSCNEHLAWHIPISDKFPKQTVSVNNFLKLYREFVQLFKNEAYLHVCYPLPHHPISDILFCVDTEGRPVTIPETMKNKTVFNNFEKPPELGKWFAIMIITRKSVLHDSNKINGPTICKIRQLKKLGYEPILFNFNEFGKEYDIQQLVYEQLKIHAINLN